MAPENLRVHTLSGVHRMDETRVMARINGKVSLWDVLTWLADEYPTVPMVDVMLHHDSISWTRAATDEELASRQEWERDREARREEYERKTYERLKAKFEGEA